MAKPNYSFEKRQREMAKKKKKEEKEKEKAARKANPQLGGDADTPNDGDEDDAPGTTDGAGTAPEGTPNP